MATFEEKPQYAAFDPGAAARLETERRLAVEDTFDQFFDPSVDTHSAFYMAMQLDKHAAHIVAGTAFVDLNNVVLRTECNNSYESMNEDDMKNLRKLMWEVYVPHMKETLKQKMSTGGETEGTNSFQAQMYVVHLSVRVAQALQLVFELNQKKTFSAVAKAAYEMALQDILYHPNFVDRIQSDQYEELIHFLRRHRTYAPTFNAYVGYKLLRQQLVRGGGAGTNRKSNDAERLHDEAANRLWDVFDKNPNIVSDFDNADLPFKMKWHQSYYKEVAQTLYSKLSKYGADDNSRFLLQTDNTEARKTLHEKLYPLDRDPPAATETVLTIPIASSSRVTTISSTPHMIDIVSAINESRETVYEGTAKRPRSRSAGDGNMLGIPALMSHAKTEGKASEDPGGSSNAATSKIDIVRSAYNAWFK